MTQYLPPNLLALFAARDPLQFLPPADKLPHEKNRVPYYGVGDFLEGFEFNDAVIMDEMDLVMESAIYIYELRKYQSWITRNSNLLVGKKEK